MARIHDELADDEIDRLAALYAPLGASVRDLVDAAIRTEVDELEVRAVTAEIEAIVARLRTRQSAGAFGIPYGASGRSRPWGNAAIGLRNGIAPPLRVVRGPEGRVWSDVTLGAAYEGPPGLVHGGVAALVLDHVMGECASATGRPGYTGTLTLRYRAGAPLGSLRVDAWVESANGAKTVIHGALRAGDLTCVEAEGIFVVPRDLRGGPPVDLLGESVHGSVTS
ncbi:MAG TPA: PaaI family thioesterase [Marmoricola sp.]|nr:PaaI family thioesterase [Marmoricola sp.]